MATIELGTNANDSLQIALTFEPGYGSGMAAADIATVNIAILSDATGGNTPYVVGGQFTAGGQLFVPRRGVLRVLPGDVVGVDSTGWPILVSANAIANGPWTTSS